MVKKTYTQHYISIPIYLRIPLGLLSILGIYGVFRLLHHHEGALGWPDYTFAMVAIGIFTTIAVPEIMLPVIGKLSPSLKKRLSDRFISPSE